MILAGYFMIAHVSRGRHRRVRTTGQIVDVDCARDTCEEQLQAEKDGEQTNHAVHDRAEAPSWSSRSRPPQPFSRVVDACRWCAHDSQYMARIGLPFTLPEFRSNAVPPARVDTGPNHRSRRRNSCPPSGEASCRNRRTHGSRCRHPLASLQPTHARTPGTSAGRSCRAMQSRPLLRLPGRCGR